MSSETVAALVGAGVGGAIGFLAQLGVLWSTNRRDRRAAAHLIFSELATNMTIVIAALEYGAWPSLEAHPQRTAIDTYGVRLLSGRSLERVGHVAGAYNRLDELAWQWHGAETPTRDQMEDALLDIRLGLYEVGRVTGMSDRELESRELLDDDVRARRDERRKSMAESRGSAWWRRRLL